MTFIWKTDIEDANKISEHNLNALLTEADKRLQGTVSSHDQLHMRAGILLTFVIAFSAWLTDNQTHPLLIIYLLFAITSCVFALMVIIPRKIDVPGYCPDLLYKANKMEKTEKEFNALLIRQYGHKIVDNIDITDRMGKYLNYGVLSFVIGVGLYLTTTGLLAIWNHIVLVAVCR